MNSKLPINMEKQPSSEQTLWKLSDKRSHHVSFWIEQPSSTVHRNAKLCACPSPSDKLTGSLLLHPLAHLDEESSASEAAISFPVSRG